MNKGKVLGAMVVAGLLLTGCAGEMSAEDKYWEDVQKYASYEIRNDIRTADEARLEKLRKNAIKEGYQICDLLNEAVLRVESGKIPKSRLDDVLREASTTSEGALFDSVTTYLCPDVLRGF